MRLAPLVALSAVASLARAAGPVPAAGADPIAERLRSAEQALGRDVASPRALVPLVELSTLEDEVPDLAALADVYRKVAGDTRAHQEVRAYARYRLADVERSRGRLDASRAELERLAFVPAWQIAGPFDNDGKRGFDEVFPPERDQDLGARFPGKAREVGWRTLPPEATATGFAHVGAAIRPGREVVVYALAVVDAPREERVRLYLGASGAAKVFVNGKLVLADPTYHPARLDQQAVAFTLRRGPNRVLVKLCHADGRLGFFARLTDDRGEPRPLPCVAVPPLPPAQPAAARRAEPVPGVIAVLERRAREARGDAAALAHYDLAVALAERRPGEDRERRATAEARRAARLAPGSVGAQLLAARLDDDANRRRAYLEAALRAAPDDPVALTALAHLELQRNRLARARQLLARGEAAAPGYAQARLLSADLDEQAGLEARARRAREALAAAAPQHPGAVAAAARAARAEDHGEEAARLLRGVLALRFDDAAARATLVQLLVDRADVDAAERLLADAVRLAPAELSPRLRRADLLAANGRPEDAEAAYADALRIAPEEAEILERRGQARLRAGRTADALADFQAALELKPQNPQLKELVRAIEPKRERFERPYLADARELARSAPAAAPDDDAVVLSDLKVTRVFPSGLSSSFTQTVVKVLNARGADAWRTYAVAYAPSRQEVRVERARVLKPDGTAVETFQETDHSTSEPWYRLYYDSRARQLAFPALQAGDVLEIAVRTDDVASENLLSDYFGDVVFLGDGARKARADYVLLVPEGRRIHASEPALPRLERSERTLAGGVVERRWVATDVPRLRPEPNMPGPAEVVPYVHVSTYASWDDVARFYWGLVREQLAPTPEIREVAMRIAAEVRAERRARGLPDAGDELAVVEAVHRFVVTNTRYVALEFGIHGYKPYRVDQILDRRFGDCKDKASLTHALLESVGVDSRLVLLRMRKLGRMPEKPASLAVFNHAILYVPKYDLWLDGTASYSGSRDLPAQDRGATVLVVNPAAPARFAETPEARPEDNLVQSRYDIALAEDGSAVVTADARVAGAQAPVYRRAFAAEGDRRPQLEGAMSRTFPGLTVREVVISDLSRLEEAVSMRFSFSVSRLAERDGDALRLQPFGATQAHAEALAPLSSRRFDLEPGEPRELRLAFRYALPRGFRAAELPEPVGVDTALAAYSATYRAEPGAFVAEARIVLKTGRVPVAQYAEFRELVTGLDRALARPVRVARDLTAGTARVP